MASLLKPHTSRYRDYFLNRQVFIMLNLDSKHQKLEKPIALTPFPHTIKDDKKKEAPVYFISPYFTLHKGNAKEVLENLASNYIDCIVTSPPYYGKRDYEVEDQIGLEDHPQTYVNNLVSIFREAHRVLKPTGSLWVNIGDTY